MMSNIKYRALSYRQLQSLALFSFIFVLPLLLEYHLEGIKLRGDFYLVQKAYITDINGFFLHLSNNFFEYLNILKNPILHFFIAGLVVQKIIFWLNTDDNK